VLVPLIILLSVSIGISTEGSFDLPNEDPWSLKKQVKKSLDEKVGNRYSGQRVRLKALGSRVFWKGDLFLHMLATQEGLFRTYTGEGKPS
jgi:hypothetical protein